MPLMRKPGRASRQFGLRRRLGKSLATPNVPKVIGGTDGAKVIGGTSVMMGPISGG
ncbi:hypothetical protein Golob_017413, partial [Gossypium lobatum]|nr:hypothetical protein [Gossypium lobatum]